MRSSQTALVGALLALAAAGCVNRQAIEQGARTRDIIADPKTPVVVESLYPKTVRDTIEVTGSIAADDDVVVGSLAAGRVVRVSVKDGDRVTQGQVLAVVEDVDAQNRLRQALSGVAAARAQLQQARTEAAAGPLRSASAIRAAEARLRQTEQTVAKLRAGSRDVEKRQADIQVARAKSDLDTAKLAVDRSRRLFNEGAISKSDLEAVENRYDNALAAYEGALENRSLVLDPVRQEDLRIAEQELAAAREAVRIERTNKSLDANYKERVNSAQANLRVAEEQVRLAQKGVSDTVVKAPISGRISGRPVQPGSVVAPGTPVARIVSLEGLYFEPEVTEGQVSQVQPGTQVTISIQALGDRAVQGSVVAVNPQASDVGRLYTVRTRIVSPPDALKPGMFAKGEIVVGTSEGIYEVPDQAVLRDGDNAWVMVYDEGKAARKNLQVRKIRGAIVEAKGLQPGDEVIVQGQVGLLAGSELRKESKSGAKADTQEDGP